MRRFALKAKHAEKVLAAFLATCAAQCASLLSLSPKVELLFGARFAHATVSMLERGAAGCSILLALLGVVLALSESIANADPPPP